MVQQSHFGLCDLKHGNQDLVLHPQIHCKIIHDRQGMETTQVSIDG